MTGHRGTGFGPNVTRTTNAGWASRPVAGFVGIGLLLTNGAAKLES